MRDSESASIPRVFCCHVLNFVERAVLAIHSTTLLSGAGYLLAPCGQGREVLSYLI